MVPISFIFAVYTQKELLYRKRELWTMTYFIGKKSTYHINCTRLQLIWHSKIPKQVRRRTNTQYHSSKHKEKLIISYGNLNNMPSIRLETTNWKWVATVWWPCSYPVFLYFVWGRGWRWRFFFHCLAWNQIGLLYVYRVPNKIEVITLITNW